MVLWESLHWKENQSKGGVENKQQWRQGDPQYRTAATTAAAARCGSSGNENYGIGKYRSKSCGRRDYSHDNGGDDGNGNYHGHYRGYKKFLAFKGRPGFKRFRVLEEIFPE